MADERPLIFTVTQFVKYPKNCVMFSIEIIDEYTLQVLEKKYAGNRLKFDGGRTFGLDVTIPIKGLNDNDPAMWQKLQEKAPETVQNYILERLRGNV
jgi:hypothetical protein